MLLPLDACSRVAVVRRVAASDRGDLAHFAPTAGQLVIVDREGRSGGCLHALSFAMGGPVASAAGGRRRGLLRPGVRSSVVREHWVSAGSGRCSPTPTMTRAMP